MTNLFVGLTSCGYCGSAMRVKGTKPRYFLCKKESPREVECIAPQILYNDMETAVFEEIMDTTPLELPVDKDVKRAIQREFKILKVRVNKRGGAQGVVEWLERDWLPRYKRLQDRRTVAIEMDKCRASFKARLKARLSGPALETAASQRVAAMRSVDLADERTRAKLQVALKEEIEQILIAPFFSSRPETHAQFGFDSPIESDQKGPAFHFAQIDFKDKSFSLVGWDEPVIPRRKGRPAS